MTLFYVYMRWYREADARSADSGRQLLTCSSRNAADEFYRALQTVRHADGRLWFTHLERRTPQFWTFDSIDGEPWHTVLLILRTRPMAEFRNRIMSQLLTDATGRDWETIAAVDEPDWTHEGAYFIRNKRQPHLYWYHFEGAIHISDTQKTKFRICGTAFEKGQRVSFIRSDDVQIRPLSAGTAAYLTREHDSNKVRVSWDSRTWKFGDLLGGFGTTWEKKGETVHELLTCASNEEGDNWELC